MMHPLVTLDDGTEIVHSGMLDDGSVRVYVERPDAGECFLSASCRLPGYEWSDVRGFSEADLDRFRRAVESRAHLVCGGAYQSKSPSS